MFCKLSVYLVIPSFRYTIGIPLYFSKILVACKESLLVPFSRTYKNIFIFQSKRDLITGLKTRTNAGRPNWDKVFKELQAQKKGKITVFFCGSPQLGKILKLKCDEFGFDYRKENFWGNGRRIFEKNKQDRKTNHEIVVDCFVCLYIAQVLKNGRLNHYLLKYILSYVEIEPRALWFMFILCSWGLRSTILFSAHLIASPK